MAWAFDIAFGIDPTVAEITFRFARRNARRFRQAICRADDAHALAAPACRSLDEKGKSNPFRGVDKSPEIASRYD